MAIDPITGALIGGGINLLGNLLGGLFAGDDQKKAIAAAEEAQSIIDAVGAPPDTAKAIILNKFRVAGLETPELEQAVNVGVSKLAQYKEDPRFREAGAKALEKMMQQSEQGLTAQDRLAVRQLQQEQERATQSKLAQIRQEAQMRGMGGAGAGLAAELSAAQAGAERGLTGAMEVGAQSQRARMAAIQDVARQAQSMRGADLATAEVTGRAEDELKRFTAQEAIARQQRNIAAQNLAEQRNIAAQTDANRFNTVTGNEELRRQREATAADWTRGLAYGQARAATRNNMSNVYGQRAGATQQSFGDMAKGASDIFGAATRTVAKYNEKTGESLYDPVTGKPYDSKKIGTV
jgi:hypothetical protein